MILFCKYNKIGIVYRKIKNMNRSRKLYIGKGVKGKRRDRYKTLCLERIYANKRYRKKLIGKVAADKKRCAIKVDLKIHGT